MKIHITIMKIRNDREEKQQSINIYFDHENTHQYHDNSQYDHKGTHSDHKNTLRS